MLRANGVQVSVQLRDHGGTFTDRRGHALHRTRANVTDREHSGQGGLERHRSSLAALGSGSEIRGRTAGLHESLGVHTHSAWLEPVGIRHGAGEQEYVVYRAPLLFPARPMAPAN